MTHDLSDGRVWVEVDTSRLDIRLPYAVVGVTWDGWAVERVTINGESVPYTVDEDGRIRLD